mgnify:CR=1 FL=1
MKALVEQQVSFARGMQDTSAPSEFRSDEVELLLNGRVSFLGNSIDRRGGSAKSHTSALNSGAQGYGAKEFSTAAGAQQLCVFVGDKFYYSTNEGVSWTQAATGLSTAYWDMVQMRVGSANYLVCVNGSTNAYYWDGATWGTLSNAPSGAKYAAVFNDRLYLGGHSGVTIAACAVGNPNVWANPSGFSVEFTTHDGEQEITGLYQIGPILMAFKRESTGYLEGFGFQTLEVEAGGRGLSRSVGLLGFRSVAAAGEQGVCWLAERGFVYYAVGGQIQLISRPIQSFLDTISWTNIKDGSGIPTSLYWPQKNEYWCALPSASGQNDYVFRWRPPTASSRPCIMLDKHGVDGESSVFVGSDGNLQIQGDLSRDQVRVASGNMIIASTGMYTEVTSGNLTLAQAAHDHAALFSADRDTEEEISAPWSLGYDGFIRKLDVGNTDNATDPLRDDGNAVSMRVKTRPMLFKDQLRKKRLRTFRVASSQDAESTLIVVPKYDGSSGTAKTLTMPVTQSGKASSVKSRTSVKGYALQLDISTSEKVSVGAVEVIAEALRQGY